MSFALERWGEFGCHVWGASYCSIQPEGGHYTFRYSAEVEADSLDDHGYVMDQNELHAIFTSMQRTQLSCERLAEYFVARIRSAVGRPRRVRVCIQPPPYQSKIVATWESRS